MLYLTHGKHFILDFGFFELGMRKIFKCLLNHCIVKDSIYVGAIVTYFLSFKLGGSNSNSSDPLDMFY